MRLGVLGGGQLGRMLGQAALPLGVRCTFVEPAADPCAAAVGAVIRAPYDDADALRRLAASVDVVTWEFENVPVHAVRQLAEHVRVHPSPASLEAAQDRLDEKRFFAAHGVPTAPTHPVDDLVGLRDGLAALGTPAILKTRRFGYDGKGQARIDEAHTAEAAWGRVGARPAVLEGVVPFDRELSLLAVRGRDGTVACWPLVENHHDRGILAWSLAPAPQVPAAIQATAEGHARRLLEALDYVGVLAIEWFQVGDRLIANEMAPRVHNSGHWSIEGAVTSQFENHVRAVLGWPLGLTAVPAPCACVNVLGEHVDPAALLAVPGARLHDYAKEARPGRKLGHVTVLGPDRDAVLDRVSRVRAILG